MQYLLWQKYSFEQVSGTYLAMQIIQHGIWFWIYAIQGYFLVLSGALLIFWFYFQSEKIFRGQSTWIIIGALLPLVTNFVYLSRIVPGLTKDYSPIGYTLAGICFAIGIIRYQLLDLMPVARARLVDVMRDGAIVLDQNNRVVDMNPAARRMLSVPEHLPLGESASVLLVNWEKWLNDLALLNSFQEKIEISDYRDGETWWYDMHVTQITDWRNKPGGKLIMHNDVTKRKQVEAALRVSQEELEQRVVERTAELAALNATLEQRVSGRTRDLTTLYEISNIASQAANIQELLNQTLNRTMAAIPCQSAAVYLLDVQENMPADQLNLIVHKGTVSGLLPIINVLTFENKIIAKVTEQSKPMLISDTYPNELFDTEILPQTESNYLIAPPAGRKPFLGHRDFGK